MAGKAAGENDHSRREQKLNDGCGQVRLAGGAAHDVTGVANESYESEESDYMSVIRLKLSFSLDFV